MTIETQVSAVDYQGNGATTQWDYEFLIPASNGDPNFEVFIVNRQTGEITNLALLTDFTITGLGDPAGGVVTYPLSGAPLSDAFSIVIRRTVPYIQPVDLQNQGGFYLEVIEKQLDFMVMQTQQLKEQADRAVTVPITTSQQELQQLAQAILNLNNSLADVQTVAGISTEVTIVSGVSEDVSITAGIAPQVVTVAGVADEVTAVAVISSAVETVAQNVTDVTNFADVYLGPKAEDPTTRNDGSPLQPGDLYFNATLNILKYYDGSIWRAGTGDMQAVTYDPTGVNANAFASINHVFNEGGAGSRPTKAADLFGQVVNSQSFFDPTSTDDQTLGVQAFIDRCIATGRVGALYGRPKVTSDLIINGDLEIIGVGRNPAIVSDGAEMIELVGTLADARIRFENVGLEGFSRSALWLADGAQVSLDCDRCVFDGNRVAISAQGDPSIGGYTLLRYNIPNPNTHIKRLNFSRNEVKNGVCGLGISCVYTDALVTDNHFHDLVNADTTGGQLDLVVHAIRLLFDGMPKEASGKYNDNYDRQRRAIITGNRIFNLRQEVSAKNINAVNVSGFSVVIANNVLENIDGTQADDGEGIYAKAAECLVVCNTLKNAGGDQAAINVKGVDVSVENIAGSNTSHPGRSRIVGFNNILYENTPPGYICVGINVGASPCLVIGNVVRGITSNGVIVAGEFMDGYSFEEVQIIGNRFEGTQGNAVAVRGGGQGVIVQGNVNLISGGEGPCSFFEIAQTRDPLYQRILVKDNIHRVTARSGNIAYNAFARISLNLYDAKNIVIEGNMSDHVISGAENYGLFVQATGARSLRGLVMRNNSWPENLPIGRIAQMPNIDLEYVLDERITTTTADATSVYAVNVRLPDNARGTVEFKADAIDTVTRDVAHYHKKALGKRVGGTTTKVGGADVVLAEIEEDATWNAAPVFMGTGALIQIKGDATNPVRWDIRMNISVDTVP